MASVNRAMGMASVAAMVAAQLAPVPMLAPVGLSPAAAQANRLTVPCYSTANRTQTCSLPDGTQSVTFMGPDRSNRCVEGQTWRRVGNTLQVQNGCGGNFEAVTRGGSWGGSGGNWGGGSGGGWGGSGGSWGGQNQGFAGELTCRSRDNREERCPARTEGRVVMLQQLSNSACIEGRSWRHDRNSITVRNGCQARFGYGQANGGNWGGGGWGGSNQGFAGQLECRSENNRYRRCGARTDGRAQLLRQFSSSSCSEGRSWGHDRSGIWVDNGCQGRFGYGYGNVSGDTSGDGGGSNTGAVIGGVALAAGLVALLAAAGKGNSRSAGASGSAASVSADLSKFPADARPSADACMKEAGRQVGATGGTRVTLDRVDRAERSGQGWLLMGQLTGNWPDHSQRMMMDCRASGTTVTAFEVR